MTSKTYPKLRTMIAPDYPEAYQAMLEIGPEWYEEMAKRDLPRLLAVAKLTPDQIAWHWAKWNEDTSASFRIAATGEYVGRDGNLLSPEEEESARAYMKAARSLHESGDMTGFQELGIFPPAGDPAYEELGIPSPTSDA